MNIDRTPFRWRQDAVDVASGAVVADLDLVGVCVFEAVVPSAAQGELVDVGGRSQNPPSDVVDLAQGPWNLTAPYRACRIEGFEDLALCGGGESNAPPEVERDASSAWSQPLM
ncbi:hypothetical protein E1287_28405 [Actinomadura sp. KC06]|nr:hypothetical protein E1287_28405 [Actinomadura sp. KC06]